MSEQDNNPAIETRSMAEQIDSMLVSAGEARGELPVMPRSAGHPSMSVTLRPGEVATYSYNSPQDEALAAQQASEPEADIPDDGRDLMASARQLSDAFEDLHRKLSAVKYDPHTGQPSYVLEGDDRARAELQHRQSWDDLQYELQRNAKIEVQRERNAAAKQAQAQAELQREQWLNEQAVIEADREIIRRRAAEILRKRGL